ncbi:hypothetical protein [Photobacterium angustum]|uniref:hypothetical protein n=1 Tax=Photobacterium angustum TaxID=661 RepID=UPI0015E6C8B7|nr:hypothetical protein [Photobacterium angustum]
MNLRNPPLILGKCEAGSTDGEFIIEIDGILIVADAEGLTIYNDGTVNELIVSS